MDSGQNAFIQTSAIVSIVILLKAMRMALLRLLFAITIALAVPLVYAENYGKYVGTVQTVWLDQDGRKMRLLAPFAYFDRDGQEWVAPKGSVIDGASIPQFAWSVIGGPFEGKYRNASVIHDVSCDQKIRPWEAAHENFYWAMRASGVETWRAQIMYAAVYHFGPRWPRMVTVHNLPKEQTPIARQKALEQAAPESTAEIMATRAYGIPLPGLQKADFDIRVNPPPRRMAEGDFEELKEVIERKSLGNVECASCKPLSEKEELDNIRRFLPGR